MEQGSVVLATYCTVFELHSLTLCRMILCRMLHALRYTVGVTVVQDNIN